MPAQLYHSPSSLGTAANCMAAWAWDKLGGWREPEVRWADYEAHPEKYNSRQRGCSLGTATHEVFEDHFTGEPPAWSTFPGQVAQSGVHLLPHPAEGHYQVEASIGSQRIKPPHEHSPGTILNVHGVPFGGFRDLVVSNAEEALAEIYIHAPDGVALFDYKSTSNISAWAKTPAQLLQDWQANIYGLDVCLEFGLGSAPARWVYMETRKVRRAQPVDIVIHHDRALEVLYPAAQLAKEIDQIERVQDAPTNTKACGMYGGCWLHESAGGPCKARRKLGALVQARKKPRKKTEDTMTTPDMKAKFASLKGKTKAPAAAAAETPAETAAPAKAPAARKPRPSRASGKGKDKDKTPASVGQRLAEAAPALAAAEETLAEAATNLEVATTAHAEAEAAHAEALAAVQEVLA